MFSSSCARTSYVDIKALICIGAALSSGSGIRSVVQGLAVVLGAASLAACTQTHVATNKSEMISPGRQASQEYNRDRIVRAKKARGGRKKAHAFRIEQKSRRDTGRIGWDCQLLHGRNKDRVRREVQYARINGRPSHVAIRHPAARNERRQWAVRDGPRQ